MSAPGSPRLFLVAGEASGDALGAALMRALRQAAPGVAITGVGGEGMRAEGLVPLFPMSDVAVFGMTEVVGRLPTILRRISVTARAAVAEKPDAVVIIDSPDFTHRVARRIRAAAPGIPIVDYVSPTVWAWRPGRARAMAAYVDHLMAILPFEPAVHARLGGPPCTYVGHPLLGILDRLRPAPGERTAPGEGRPVLLVLPGSRRSELARLGPDFGAAVARVREAVGDVEVLLPAVPHLADEVERMVDAWPVRPHVVHGTEAKHAAFRRAHAAIAASGTVTLELALAQVPMIVAYRLDGFYRALKQVNRFIPIARVASMVLPNILLGRNVVPELLDAEVTPANLADAAVALMRPGSERRTQLDAFASIDALMAVAGGRSPAEAAAAVVLAAAAGRR